MLKARDLKSAYSDQRMDGGCATDGTWCGSSMPTFVEPSQASLLVADPADLSEQGSVLENRANGNSA
jgi:hypothetical protein